MSTYFPSGKDLAGKRKWLLVDAAGQTVGHLASEVASILSGKRNPAYTPFMDMGDHVIVINARQAVLKGNKAEQKVYRHHTRYPGGLREISATDMFAKRPDRVISLAVQGMLPKNKLGKAMAKKLKVYADAEHPHSAQRPQAHTLTPRHKSTNQS
ncbi:MAG TPA: 50S ribosomal protein L13 [Pyrinomonadaceae bacterium]|jgi:large subunit ribosomal protein L13|nr:50S ribosomal protein L13 [Pyrinomonadaceae bacterium]